MKKTTDSLQAKIMRLEEIEKLFQSPEVSLDASLELHKEAIKLAEDIHTYLNTVEQTLETVDTQAREEA